MLLIANLACQAWIKTCSLHHVLQLASVNKHKQEPPLNRFRPISSLSKLSLSLGFVLALACILGSQASSRLGQQPLSVAGQLWYSVAANNSHFSKRLKNVGDYTRDSLFDGMPDVCSDAAAWPVHSPLVANSFYRTSFNVSLYPRNYQQPQSRAPPFV